MAPLAIGPVNGPGLGGPRPTRVEPSIPARDRAAFERALAAVPPGPARAGAAVAPTRAGAATTPGDRILAGLQGSKPAFDIQVGFLGGLTGSQQAAFAEAAARWEKVIAGDLPDVRVGDETVDDLVILVAGDALDGPGGYLGVGGPTVLRPAGLGKASGLPAMGEMVLDTADLPALERAGSLVDTITHEMGHALGIGALWAERGLEVGQGTAAPRYVGPAGEAAYGRLLGLDEPAAVPLESGGGPLTQERHWSEAALGDELMTGVLDAGPNPLSRLTVASLDDLGYAVDYAGAEAFPPARVADASRAG